MGNRGKAKLSQISIITVVLIILIAIILIAIIWNLVVPLVRERGEEVQIGQFTVNLEIQGAVLFENGVSEIRVNRKSGKEELDSLRFVFYDDAGNSAIREGGSINELETKTYSFSAITEVAGFGKISKVGVAPIINGNLGMVIESKPDSVLKIPYSVASWWRFDDLTDFIGGNVCEVNSGGIGNGILNGEVNCSANGLSFSDEMAISFWVKGNSNKTIIKKGENYEISIEDRKIKFNGFLSDEEELGEDWNHVVISIDPAFSEIYVNKVVDTFTTLGSFNAGNENLIINGEVDNVMIFNRPITNIVGIYNIQKKD